MQNLLLVTYPVDGVYSCGSGSGEKTGAADPGCYGGIRENGGSGLAKTGDSRAGHFGFGCVIRAKMPVMKALYRFY